MVRFEDADGAEPGDGLAPVISLFGDSTPGRSARARSAGTAAPAGEPAWNATWADDVDIAAGSGERLSEQTSSTDSATDDAQADPHRAAFDRLLRKLRARGLSVSEASEVLRGDGVDREAAAAFIDDLLAKRWLSDADLAEQLVHAAVTRKGDGRRAIALTLAKRGISRDVADGALSALPDDDADRALEFARTKARSMSGLEHDAALRRLVGQLSRRGYPGNVAMNAAKIALEEAGVGRSGVRFR